MTFLKQKPAIGLVFYPRFAPETLPDYARRAEAAGFNELWLWDDCFLPGALTSAAVALSATQTLKVGIGLIPVPAYNPLFAAMEITTLARAFPGRFIAGFGHGVRSWMEQISSAPRSSLKALAETIPAIRGLLNGENVTIHGDWVNLEQVQMQLTPEIVPPLYVGAMREKSLRLAGRFGDGTILTSMSSPAYIQWARAHIQAGMAESGLKDHRVVVYLDAKISVDGQAARAAARQALAERLPWNDVHLEAAGFLPEVEEYRRAFNNREEAARNIPDAWLDEFAAAGTPDQVSCSVRRWLDAGADTVILQPLNGDPACLDEYIRYLAPVGSLLG